MEAGVPGRVRGRGLITGLRRVILCPAMAGRLNSFQRTMLHWNDLHPYSAIHVARVGVAVDPQRLRETVESTLQRRGIGGIEIDPGRKEYRYLDESCECTIEPPSAGEDPRGELAGIMQRQLNTPFESSAPFCPLRFFVVPEEDGFWLGLVYFHVIADAVSIVYLLRELVDAYCGGKGAADREPPDLYPRRFDNLLVRHPVVLARKLLRFPAEVRKTRRAKRARYADPHDTSLGFRLLTLSSDQLSGLIRVSKAWKVTVNDLFMALMLKALSPLAPDRHGKKRCKLSLGSIVNLRGEHGLKGEGPFGVFLGSFAITHEVPEEIDLESLAVAVRGQTRRIKKSRLPLAFPLQLWVARLFLRSLSLEQQRKFYQKNRPLWGGITNMNLNSMPAHPGETPPADYLRGVTTGPATPLVLSVSTFGKSAHIGMSYRTTVFSEPMIEEFETNFVGELAEQVARL